MQITFQFQKLREKLAAGSILAFEHAKLVRSNKILEKKFEELTKTKPANQGQSESMEEKLMRKLSKAKNLLKLKDFEIKSLKQSSDLTSQ